MKRLLTNKGGELRRAKGRYDEHGKLIRRCSHCQKELPDGLVDAMPIEGCHIVGSLVFCDDERCAGYLEDDVQRFAEISQSSRLGRFDVVDAWCRGLEIKRNPGIEPYRPKGFRDDLWAERYDGQDGVIPKCWWCGDELTSDHTTFEVGSCYFVGTLRCCRNKHCVKGVKKDLRDGRAEINLNLLRCEVDPEHSMLKPVRSTHTGPNPISLTAQYPEPGPMSRDEMVAALIEKSGAVCQGCYRGFDDPLYLELDHSRPRSDGGEDHIGNRVLLCSPCNRIKSNKLTLSGLQDHNIKSGRMMGQPADEGVMPLPDSLSWLEQEGLT